MRPGLRFTILQKQSYPYAYVNAEVGTYVAAGVAAGAPAPDMTLKQQLDTYVTALKAGSAWTPLDVIKLYAVHDVRLGLINLKNPGTFNSSLVDPTTDVVFTVDRGLTTNGTDNLVDEGINPATAGGNFTQNNALFGFRARTNLAINTSRAGWFDGTDGVTVLGYNGSGGSYRINQASSTTISSTGSAVGLWLIERTASNATRMYRNGSSVGTGTTVSTALNSHNLQLGSIAAATFVAEEYSSCYVGASLGTTVAAALSAADLAFMQARGAA